MTRSLKEIAWHSRGPQLHLQRNSSRMRSLRERKCSILMIDVARLTSNALISLPLIGLGFLVFFLPFHSRLDQLKVINYLEGVLKGFATWDFVDFSSQVTSHQNMMRRRSGERERRKVRGIKFIITTAAVRLEIIN